MAQGRKNSLYPRQGSVPHVVAWEKRWAGVHQPRTSGMEMKIDVHREQTREAQSWRRGWEWQTQSRRQKVGWGRVSEGEAVDREKHTGPLCTARCTLQRLPVSEIMDSCLNDTFPADNWKSIGWSPHGWIPVFSPQTVFCGKDACFELAPRRL